MYMPLTFEHVVLFFLINLIQHSEHLITDGSDGHLEDLSRRLSIAISHSVVQEEVTISFYLYNRKNTHIHTYIYIRTSSKAFRVSKAIIRTVYHKQA